MARKANCLKFLFTSLTLFFTTANVISQENDTISKLNGRIVYLSNHRSALVNLETREILTPSYDLIEPLNRNLYLIYQDHKKGLIDTMGHIIKAPKWTEIKGFLPDYFLGEHSFYRIRSETKKYGILNSKGEFLIPCLYDEIDITANGFMQELSHKYYLKEDTYFYFMNGNESQEIYDSLIAIEKSDPASYLNVINEFKMNPFFIVSLNNVTKVINSANETLIPFSPATISHCSAHTLLSIDEKSTSFTLFGTMDTITSSYDTACINISPSNNYDFYPHGYSMNYYITVVNKKYGIRNVYTNEEIPPIYDRLENCLGMLEDICYCGFYMEQQLLRKSPPRDQTRRSNGLLRFAKNGKMGLFDLYSFQEVAPAKFDTIGFKIDPYWAKCLVVLIDNQWTLYHKEKRELLNYQFDEINITKNRKHYQYVIKKNGKFGIIDPYGETLLSPKYDSIEWIKEKTYTLYKRGKSKEYWIK